MRDQHVTKLIFRRTRLSSTRIYNLQEFGENWVNRYWPLNHMQSVPSVMCSYLLWADEDHYCSVCTIIKTHQVPCMDSFKVFTPPLNLRFPFSTFSPFIYHNIYRLHRPVFITRCTDRFILT